jgi:hypothetical protein
MEEGRQLAPWLEVRGNHDNFDVKTRGGPQDRARAQYLCILTLLERAQLVEKRI